MYGGGDGAGCSHHPRGAAHTCRLSKLHGSVDAFFLSDSPVC